MDTKSVVLLGLVLCLQFDCSWNSPCPDIFDYEINGEKVYGKVTVKPNDNRVPEFQLKTRINFTVINIKGKQKGRLESLNIKASKTYNQGQAVTYRVHFPVISPLPKVTAIIVNEDIICEGPDVIPEPDQRINKISIQHFSFDNNYLENLITNNDCGIVDGGNEKVPPINDEQYYQRGEIPWLVALYRVVENNLLFICGGTLVSDRHVVSAAYCVKRGRATTPVTEIVVKLGVHSLSDWDDDLTITRKLTAATIHEKFNPGTLQNDILILTLNKPVPFNKYIRPVCLWSGDTELSRVVGTTGVVAGWGSRSVTDMRVKPDKPEMMRIPIVRTTDCKVSNATFHKLTYKTTLCAGDQNSVGPCTGDFGSGFYLLESGKWRLRGIVSLSIQDIAPNCDLNEYFVFTDTAQFLPWILDILLEKYFKPEKSSYSIDSAASETIECGMVPGDKEGFTSSKGAPYQLGDIPWLVGIHSRKNGKFSKKICGGTLVSDRHVITAATCMTHLSKGTAFKDFRVNIALYKNGKIGTHFDDRWKLATVSIHEDFNPKTLKNNIVILTLKKHLSFDQFVLPACLWSGDTEPSGVLGASGYVFGWGVTKSNDIINNFLAHVVRLPILSTKNCSAYAFAFTFVTHATTLCAGSLNEDPCLGYAGASLYLKEDGRWRLRGVASAAESSDNEDGTCEHYAIYTDVAQYLPWIRKIMSATYFN